MNKTSRLVGVRTYLLAGVSVLGAGVIAGVPGSSQPSDAGVTPLAAAASPTPPATTSSAVITPHTAAQPVAQPSALIASAASPGLQLSFLTGSPNLGAGNVGDFNTGIANVGVANTGANNDGNFNIGAANEGDFNIGVNNVGGFNIGIGNVGDYNVGIANTGERNFGAANSGALNVGLGNVGTANLGIGNNGSGNVGFFNTGDYTIGAFNIGIRYADSGPVSSAEETVARLRASDTKAEPTSTVRATTGSTPRVSTKDGNKAEPGVTSAQPTRADESGGTDGSATVNVTGQDSESETDDERAAPTKGGVGTDPNGGEASDNDAGSDSE